MNFKDLRSKLFSSNGQKYLTKEENDYIDEFKGLFEEYGCDDPTYMGIPRFNKLLILLNITKDHPIAKAVDAAWKEHFEYLKFKERLRCIMRIVERPQFDKYSQKMNEFKDLSDEELKKYIEKYESEAVKSRDVKALRELSNIVNDIHGIDDYWS